MIKSLKAIALFPIVILFIVFQSCLSVEDPNSRTQEMEDLEISQTIQKLETAGYDIDTTASGLYYIIHENGTGPFPVEGDTCFIEYATYFIDGVLLDASQDHFTDGIWEMRLHRDSTIAGFYEGITMINKGTEADFIIPSELGYGALGNGYVPPYTPLIFSVKLHDLKPKSE